MFEFGFYEKEITPPLGCSVPGYFSLRRVSDVLDRLYARAVVVKDDSKKIAIISADGCHPIGRLSDEIVADSIKGYVDVFIHLVADCAILADMRL